MEMSGSEFVEKGNKKRERNKGGSRMRQERGDGGERCKKN